MNRVLRRFGSCVLALASLCTAAVGSARAESVPTVPVKAGPGRSIYQRYLTSHLHARGGVPVEFFLGATVQPAALNLSAVEVSADTAAGRFAQVQPVVARFDVGSYGVFWRDESAGNFEIFGRRLGTTLAPLSVTAPLFSDGITRYPDELAGAGDGVDMMLAWVDHSGGHAYAALVNEAFGLQSNFALDETPKAEFVGAPAVASRTSHGFVAAWEEFRSGFHIFAQLLDSAGAKLGFNFDVDLGSDTLLHFAPGVACDTAGSFAVAWSGGTSSRSDVYVRLFDAAGDTVTGAIALSTPVGTESYMLPTVIYVPAADEYWISYIQTDSPADSTVLLLRRTTRTGTLLGPAVALPAGPYPWAPEFAQVGPEVTILTERFDNAAELRGMSLDASAVIVDSTSVINSAAFNDRSALSAAKAGDTIAVVWQDRRSGGKRIRGRLRDTTGNVSQDTLLSTQSLGGQQTRAALAGRSGGGIRVFMHDSQKDDGDITMAGILEDGTVDERLLMNDDATLASQYDPAAASDSSGRALVVWTDERADWSGPARHMAGRFIAAGGGFLGSAFVVPADTTASYQDQPDVAMAAGGVAAAVWIDDRSSTARGYLRLFAADRSPLTADLALNDGGLVQLVVAEERKPKVSMDSLGRIWVAWSALDVVSDSFFVLGQSFDPSGARRGATLDLSPAGKTAAALAFDLLARPDGTALLVWARTDLPSAGVWGAGYDTTGAQVVTAFRVSDSGVVAFEPVVTSDLAGVWAAAWVQPVGSGQDVVWRRFDAGDVPLDTVFSISSGAPAGLRRQPVLRMSGIYLYGAWHDNHDAGDGFDVRVSSEVYAASAVRDDGRVQPTDFALAANYPNPFNPETVIEYSLASPALVRLVVFDLLGRHVRTLEDTRLNPGYYRTRWDGRDKGGHAVASGVYFYQLTANAQVTTRKMLLLR